MPTSEQGHFDQQLTNASLAFMQDDDGFVARKVFPAVPVAQASGKYTVYPREAFFSDNVAARPMGGTPREVDHNVTRADYSIEEEALEAWLDDRERANATPPHDPEKSKIRLLTSQHKIHLERKFTTAFFSASIWTGTSGGGDIAGVASGPTSAQALRWSVAGSTPGAEIKKRAKYIKSITGSRPNKLVVGSAVDLVLQDHADVRDRVKYTENNLAGSDEAALARYFGVDEYLVADAVVNTANEGLAGSYSYIFPTDGALLVYAAANPALDTPSAGYTFTWTGLLGAGAMAVDTPVFRGRDPRAYSDWFHVRMAAAPTLVSSELGAFFTTIVA